MPDAADESALKSLADLADFNSKTAKTHTGIYRDLAVQAQDGSRSAIGSHC